MSNLAAPIPGKPKPLAALGKVEVIEEAAPAVEFAEMTERLFLLFFIKHTSVSHTLIYFKRTITISEAVEFAKRYCTNELNARFLRIEPAVQVIE